MNRLRALSVLLAVAVALSGAPSDVRAVAPGSPEPAHVLHTLPDWAPMGGFTLGHHVFLKPSQQNAMGLGHELVHVRQQAAGPLWFWSSYVVSPSWRLRWEAEAYAVQARAGCPIDGEHGLAAYLSGPAYLWTATQVEAGKKIREFL
jgi:hypothetical protein